MRAKLRFLPPFIVAALGAALCTGCIDIVQYVSANERGEPTVYLRLALQKSIFAMASSMGGEAAPDLEKSLDEDFDLGQDEVLGKFPPGMAVRYEKINTELEYGFSMGYSLSPSVERQLSGEKERPPLVPIREGGTITILFPQEKSKDEGGGAEVEQMAQLFLSSSKYRVMLSKGLVKTLMSATFITPSGEVSLAVIDLPEIYLVEVPLVHWLTAKGSCTLVLR